MGERPDKCLGLVHYAAPRQLYSTNDSDEEKRHMKGKKQLCRDCSHWCKQTAAPPEVQLQLQCLSQLLTSLN